MSTPKTRLRSQDVSTRQLHAACGPAHLDSHATSRAVVCEPARPRPGLALLGAALLALAGCQAYGDARVLVANNFQKISVEVAPEVARVAKVENVTISEKQGARGFAVKGEVTHGEACRALTLNVSFVSVKGVVLRNTSVGVPDYPGKVPARFDTVVLVDARIGSSDDVVSKVLFSQLACR